MVICGNLTVRTPMSSRTVAVTLLCYGCIIRTMCRCFTAYVHIRLPPKQEYASVVLIYSPAQNLFGGLVAVDSVLKL